MKATDIIIDVRIPNLDSNTNRNLFCCVLIFVKEFVYRTGTLSQKKLKGTS